MNKFILTIFFALILNGNVYANFRLDKCEDVEVDNKVYRYGFNQDEKKIFWSELWGAEKNGYYENELLYSTKVKSYDYLDEHFIVFAEFDEYQILILEDEKIVIEIRKSDGFVKKKRCKKNIRF